MVVSEATEQSIQQFLQSYWRWSKIDYSQDLATQLREQKAAQERKYGKKILRQLAQLSRKLESACQSQYYGAAKNINRQMFDFKYETGLCDDDIITNTRTRMTLELVLRYLSEQDKEPFTLLDLGCGDGKVTLAIAQYFTGLRKLYAVDNAQHACGRFVHNYTFLPKQAQEKAVYIPGDYTSADLVKQIHALRPEGIDYVLALYSFDHEHYGELGLPFPTEAALEQVRHFMKPEGTLLFSTPLHLPPIEQAPSPTLYEHTVEDSFEEASEEIAEKTGFQFTLYDWQSFLPGDFVMLSIATVPH